jgi:hypothetical protein
MAQMKVQAGEVSLAVMPPYPVEMQRGVLGLVPETAPETASDVHGSRSPRAVA